MDPVTAADVRAALEILSSLDPSTAFVDPLGRTITVEGLFRGRSIDEIVNLWEDDDQDEGRWIVAIAEDHRPERKMSWGWIALGVGAVIGGTWVAWRLVKSNG